MMNRLQKHYLGTAFTFISLICSIAAAGDWDFSLHAPAMLFPLGLTINGEGGYNQYLWGNKEKNGLMYGFIRPGARLSTIFVYHAGDVFLDIYPISFVHLRVGHSESYRMVPSFVVDCSNYLCLGRLASNFFQADVTLGTSNVFINLWAMVRQFTPDQSSQPFYDTNTVLIGQPGGDLFVNLSPTVVVKLRKDLMVGAFHESFFMQGSGQHGDRQMIFVGKNLTDQWSFTLGVNSYQVNLLQRGYGAAGYLKFTLKPSYSLAP